MIPKIIHYCWFGGNPKPRLAKKCIKSWRKYCPDYKIIEWNETNFDIGKAPKYVKDAYLSKKWAFVTDYVRLWAMVNIGGIYMDTDVEVINPLDKFLDNHAFSGFEDEKNIPTGIMASEKDFPLYKDLLDMYYQIDFFLPDGTPDTTTNCKRITDVCLNKGLILNGKYQVVDGFALYPSDVFCPLDWKTRTLKKTNDTCCIHWFAGSWLDSYIKRGIKVNVLKNRIKRILNYFK